RGRTKTGQLFAYARDDRPWGSTDPPIVAYVYAPDRKAARPIAHLALAEKGRGAARLLLEPCPAAVLRAGTGRHGADRPRGADAHRRPDDPRAHTTEHERKRHAAPLMRCGGSRPMLVRWRRSRALMGMVFRMSGTARLMLTAM